MDYIITKNPDFFKKIIPGELALTKKIAFCNLNDMDLPEVIALDSETTGLFPLDCDIFCIQIGTGKNNYIVHMYDDNYEFADCIPYLQGKVLIGHNITFDLKFMYKYGFYPERVFDTMIASKILYNGQGDLTRGKKGEDVLIPYRHDFGAVMKRELDVEYDKTEQKNIHIVKLSQKSTIQYSFNDVDRLIELHDALYKKILKLGFEETYKLHCDYILALAYMENCGLPLSSKKWKEKMDMDVQNTIKNKNIVVEYIYDNIPDLANRQIDLFDTKKRINVSTESPKQMIKVFKALNIDVINKEGKESIKEEVIKKSKHAFVDLWCDYQESNHRVTTFGMGIYNQIREERIYTNFNPMVDTARISSRKGGINFLNFPSDKATRICFAVRGATDLIVCDYSGQETVIAADLSGDEAMTKAVLEGADLHSAFARVLFPELKELSDEVIMKDHKAQRQSAKAPRFAFQYGGSAYTIHMKEGIPLDEAQEIENAFKELHAGLYVWGEKVFLQAIKVGYIESVDGWKLALPFFNKYQTLERVVSNITREEWTMYKQGKIEIQKTKKELKKGELPYEIRFPNSVKVFERYKRDVRTFFKLKGEYQRLCLNNPVQTEGAHQLKRATVRLFTWIKNNKLINKVLICNSIHDELVLESFPEYTEKARVALQDAMLYGGNYYLKNLEIKAEAGVGKSWAEAK